MLVSGSFHEGHLTTLCISDSTGLVLISSSGIFIKLYILYLSGPSETQLLGDKASQSGTCSNCHKLRAPTLLEVHQPESKQVIFHSYKTVQNPPYTANHTPFFSSISTYGQLFTSSGLRAGKLPSTCRHPETLNKRTHKNPRDMILSNRT